jgi:two-component system CheB/CheR fusion protein
VTFPGVGLGGSAGGIEAVSRLLRALPTDTGMAFIAVQHLSPTHASVLADILARETRMPVAEIHDGTALAPDRVYVMPPNASLVVRDGVLHLAPLAEKRVPSRGIDSFMRSLAEDIGHLSVGVVLSGSDADGTQGLAAIKAAGGITFAQDASAMHDSMPRSAVAAGCVDFELPPERIAEELTRIARHAYVAPVPPGEVARSREMTRILEVLRAATDVDFSNYKPNTLYRRISRRAVLHKCESLADYVKYLQGNAAEVDALYSDILINVTSFFRNAEAFEALKARVFPRITQERGRHEPVRIWVQGCSTGEEAYSLAIAFTEYCEATGRGVPLQIFATDLSGASVERARIGLYSKAIASDLSADRLRRFFVEVDGSYRIAKSIRDKCVFAKHNVLTSPPFSNIDLVTCRNLLIYLEPVLQQKLLPVLHYALRPHGYLWLGGSETIGAFRDLFDLEDAKHKIYSKKPGRSRALAPTLLGGIPLGPLSSGPRTGPSLEAGLSTADALKEADRILLGRYSPPGVLVNDALEIVQFRGDTTRWLAPASGKASLSLLKMLREGLLVAVRAAIQKARREGQPVREAGLRVRTDSQWLPVDIEVIPVGCEAGREAACLILFEEPHTDPPRRNREEPRPAPPEPFGKDAAEREVSRLNRELTATREYLQSVIEQQEAANEELQSANEEVQSSNEELQSINEELETSKEEIQSSNEELATVNDELHTRNLELTQSNNDLVNLLASVQMAIVMLGEDLRIRRFTPMAEKMLNLIPADVGRPISDIKLNITVPDLEPLLTEAIETVSTREIEVQDRNGRWHLLRIRPYKTMENKIEGAVLLLVDVDTLKRNEEMLRRQNSLLEQTHEPILVWNLETGALIYWNHGAEELYGWTREEAVGSSIFDLLAPEPGPGVWREPLQRSGQWTGELAHRTKDRRSVDVESHLVLGRDIGGQSVIIQTDRTIGDRKQAERALRQRAEHLAEVDRNRNEFLAMLAHELRNPLAPLRNSVELLKQPDVSSESLDRVRDVLDRQTASMTRLVDDLLDVARITRGRIGFQMAPLDIVPLLRRVAEDARVIASARARKLTARLPPGPVWVKADAVRLEQVLGNLLDNAFKFTARGGHVSLTADVVDKPQAEGRKHVVIRVTDDGIGMTADDLARVFGLFVQAETGRGRSRGGLGIGLTLARRLVEEHEGTLDASSPGHDKGSEFVVTLPVTAAPAEVEGPTAEPASESPAPKRILVVDDNGDAGDSLAAVLRAFGHVVEIKREARSALAAIETFHPEVAIFDIGMPGMDGYELAREVRRRPANGSMLLIAVTGYGRDEDRRRGLEAGFDHYVMKPCKADNLLRLIQSRP